jgi:iron complex outermembrane receptor protein
MLTSMSVRGALIAIACAISMSAHAIADTPKQIDIPAGELRSALLQLSKTFGVELLYQPGQLKDFSTKGVRGTYTPDAAIRILLRGIPLELRTDPSGAMLIAPHGVSTNAQPTPAETGDEANKEGKKDSSDQFRVAQVDQGQTSSPSTVEMQDEQESKKKPVQLEEVIVTGSRIPIASGQERAQPVQIYSREDINRSGQTTVGDFLNTLPDVSINNVEGDFESFLGRTTVQLHGLPAGTTLTLLNGRQIESSYYGYFDLGAVPTAAVERIEVLPVGSSAVYGSDALAGAVNMILRKDFDGLEVNAKYARATGTGEDDFSMAWGKTFERGSITLVANYQGRTQLLANDRSITSTTDIPADARSIDLTDTCSPGNVYSLNGQPLPGLGTASEAGIPAGVIGKPTIQAFQPTAGKVNQCNLDLGDALIPTTHREGALLTGHYEFSDSVDLFSETLFSQEYQANAVGYAISLYGGSFGYTTIGAGNPYNPFGIDLGVSYTYPGIPSTYNNWQTFVRPLVGIRGSLAADWKYEVTTLVSLDRAHDHYSNSDQTRLQSALDSTDPATAFNPFTAGSPGSSQLLDSLLDNYLDWFKNQLLSTQAIVRGPLVNLPSGPLQTVLGAQFDREQLVDNNDYFGESPFSLELSRHSYALFTEERVPLLADHAKPESGERLALSVAGRYDKYSDFGGKATGQGGLEWRPSNELLLRAAYATSYKAPELQQIAGGVTATFTSEITDPYRGNSSYSPLTEVGSNPKLQPETGNSHVFGVVYDSMEYPGLKASLSYFAIDIANYISQLAPQVLVDFPTLFPGAVTRVPPTPQDQQLGYLGVITNISDIYYNYGDIRVSGVDFDLSHRLSTVIGDFRPSLSVTDMVRYRSALTPGSPEVSYLGRATFIGPGFTPHWKGTMSVVWERGALSTALAGRYIGSYRDYQELVPNTNELGNTWYCDLNIHYDLSKALSNSARWYGHSYIELGAVNLFNNLPKFSYGSEGYDFRESDIRGRVVYAQFGLKL